MSARTSKRTLQSASKRNPLVNILGMLETYRFDHRPSDLLGHMLDEVLARLSGRHATVPDDIRQTIDDAADAYFSLASTEPLGHDNLGDIYMMMRSNWKGSDLGQFFTPTEVCKLMASISGVPDALPMPGGRPCRILEPACGSGAMLLATIEAFVEKHGPTALNHMSLTAIDVDPLCCKMAATQIMMCSWKLREPFAEVLIFRGNALGPSSEWTLMMEATPRPGHQQLEMPLDPRPVPVAANIADNDAVAAKAAAVSPASSAPPVRPPSRRIGAWMR